MVQWLTLRHTLKNMTYIERSNAEIAAQTSLSINSIKSYIRSCYRKIDVDSRSMAAGRQVLAGYRGTVVADGYRVYESLSRDGLQMRCVEEAQPPSSRSVADNAPTALQNERCVGGGKHDSDG